MSLEDYNKPALSFSQQVARLKARGLRIDDESAAEQKLARCNYYRLSAYWYPFRQLGDDGNVQSHMRDGTTFSQVVDYYEFDRKLRGLVLDAIERVEIAIRTKVTYLLGHHYGPFAHLDPNNFHRRFRHQAWLSKIRDETERSSEKFIEHFSNKYNGFPNLPIWMLTEIMSFGALSRLYKGMKNNKSAGITDKQDVASTYNVHYKTLEDWLHCLVYVRNVCAHHSRLWNRELAIRPRALKSPNWLPPVTPVNFRIFYPLLILRSLQSAIGMDDAWAYEVTNLIEPFAEEQANRNFMGLPDNWRQHPIWNTP